MRATELGELGSAGLQALAYLETGTAAPAGWLDAQRAVLAEAQEPSGLVRFVFLPDLDKLIEQRALRRFSTDCRWPGCRPSPPVR